MSSEALTEASQVDPHTGWRYVRLGDLISLRGGLSYKGEFISESGNAMVTMGCITPSAPFKWSGLKRYQGTFGTQHVLSVGDLVIATRDVTQNRELIGCPALVPSGLPGDAIIAATNLYKVINHSDTENEFLYWVMKSPSYREQVVASAKGTTVVMLTKDAVENFVFPLPPPAERRSICELLSGIDRRIALLSETNATLEAIAQALFKSWFVDFDPVRAKMEGRTPEGMDEATAALFPDGFETSELGEVPRGWRVSRLADVTERITKGTTPTTLKRAFVPSGINFVKAESMTGDGGFIAEKFAFIDTETHALLARSQLQDGDVLISIAGTIGRLAVMTGDYLPANTNQAVALIRPNPNLLPGGLIYRFLRLNESQQKLAEKVVQAVQANLSLGTLSDLKLVVPPPRGC